MIIKIKNKKKKVKCIIKFNKEILIILFNLKINEIN